MPPLRNVYYPYIYVELASGFSLTKSFRDNDELQRPDYFTSLTHIRYVDKANTATINLSFVPLDRDPNQLETEIVKSKGLIRFQYGYLGQVSREYRGLIYDYSVSISDGALLYTLQIMSQAVMANYVILSDTSDTEESDDSGATKTPEIGWENAYEVIKYDKGDEGYKKLEKKPDDWDTNWNKYYKKVEGKSSTDYEFYPIKEASSNKVDGTSYTIKDDDDANKICERFNNLVNDTLGDVYTFDLEESKKALSGLSDQTAKGQSCNGCSPIEYMQLVLRGLVDKSDIDKDGKITDPKTKMYKLVINDSTQDDAKGKIFISLVDSSKVAASYEFNWGTRDSDIISWDPQYKGSYAIFKGRGVDVTKIQTKNVNTNPDGTVSGFTVDAAAMRDSSDYVKTGFPYNTPGDDDDYLSNIVSDVETFRENADYCYTATLKVLGVAGKTADELKLCESTVQVTPYINGIAHHSGGRYVIKGITDEVSSTGFTTKFDLYRSATSGNSNVNQSTSNEKDDSDTKKE